MQEYKERKQMENTFAKYAFRSKKNFPHEFLASHQKGGERKNHYFV